MAYDPPSVAAPRVGAGRPGLSVSVKV